MKKPFRVFVVIAAFALLFLALPSMALAAEEGGATGGARSPISDLAKAIAIAVAACGGAIGQGMATSRAVESVARNPSANADIRLIFILGLALIESLVIYALVIAFII